MSTNFTLDDIRAAAERKYGNVNITLDEKTTVTLLNPLRLETARRDELAALQDRLTDSNSDDEVTAEDQEEALRQALRLVCESPAAADRLEKALGNDLTMYAAVFEVYSGGVEAGEASGSQD